MKPVYIIAWIANSISNLGDVYFDTAIWEIGDLLFSPLIKLTATI